jgi:Fe-S cluster assembly protein SufD
VLEEGSQVQIVEHSHYEGDEKSVYFANIVNEIYVEKHAKCTHYKLQQDSFKAIHISNTAVNVKDFGEYTKFCVQTGANIGRDETNVCLTAQKAQTQIYGIYKMSGWATIDFTSNIEHMVADTHSQELVKGVADGHSRGVFQAGVYIAKDAVNTDAKQLHKGILLSDDAEVNAKPWLKIYADDVKCSHGSAMGELDKDQLFYLCSRGIEEEQAKKILIDAFLQDMFSYIDNPQIQQWFSKNV